MILKMDNSQNSNVFSDIDDYVCISNTTKDAITYDHLISNTKSSLTRNVSQAVQKPSFHSHFSSLLEDCNCCIGRSLDLITSILNSSKDINVSELHAYMEDAVSLLNMMSSFIKSVVESISLSCCEMRLFPTTTGRIIRAVFTHCKDSEKIYGNNLKSVEKQLKDLFRNCHELQLTYLMILEKHFIFDLSEKDELDVLIEALSINLEIGEIVQTLDVKTMAEQWKAYTALCEKHSPYLLDTHIYEKCCTILCHMIENNLRTALEINQDEKLILRSLKVSNFTIKILLKICNIFKQSERRNKDDLLETLLYIYQNDPAHLELLSQKSHQFITQLKTNVSAPSESLVKEMVLHENFIKSLNRLDVSQWKTDDKALGFILLVISAIKWTLHRRDDSKTVRHKLMECVFKFLRHGHVWFNIGLKFKMEVRGDDDQTYGLFEHLLTTTLALASVSDYDEISTLERNMYQAILSADSMGALFSSNLWILLARMSPRQYLLSQVLHLCTTYQKLDNIRLFHNSPQQRHLQCTMSRLFECMHKDDKISVYKKYSIHDETNVHLWTALKIKNLPDWAQSEANHLIGDRLNVLFQLMFNGILCADEVISLNQYLRLAATCTFTDNAETIEGYVARAWLSACPKTTRAWLLNQVLDGSQVWCLEYIEGLTDLTCSLKYLFLQSVNLVKVLHVVSEMVHTRNTELKLILSNLVCQIATCSIHDRNKHLIDSLLQQSFQNLLQDNHGLVKNKCLNILRLQMPNKNIESLMSRVAKQDNSLHQTWNYLKHGKLNVFVWKEQLIATNFEYRHKCIGTNECIVLSDSVSVNSLNNTQSNFDFADVETLFEEPACKKVKLNANETEEIISRLESDSSLLCLVKENVFSGELKNRIRNVCEKLKNILD